MLLRNTAGIPQADFELAWYAAKTVVFNNKEPKVNKIWIRNSSGNLSGHMKWPKKEIVVSLPKDDYFPSPEAVMGDEAPIYCLNDRLEGLTAVIAHELKHLHTFLKHVKIIRAEWAKKSFEEVVPLSQRPHSEIECEKCAVIALNKLRTTSPLLTSDQRLNLLKLNDHLWEKTKIRLFDWNTTNFLTLKDLEEVKTGS